MEAPVKKINLNPIDYSVSFSLNFEVNWKVLSWKKSYYDSLLWIFVTSIYSDSFYFDSIVFHSD